MKTDKPIVMRDSPEAAQPHTMTGWLSRDGFFFKEESVARYSGCTHVACSRCGQPTEKMYAICPGCRELAAIERYEAMPKEPWDGVCMLYSDAADRYFQDWDEVMDFCEDQEPACAPEDLRLQLTEGRRPREIDPNDYCQDELPEDGEVDDKDFLAACEALNAVIRKMSPMSWWPRKVAMQLPARGNTE